MKTLIISPHSDDALFGCFSFLKGSHVVVCGIDESECPEDEKHRLSLESKKAETHKLMCEVEANNWMVISSKVNLFYTSKYVLIKAIEDKINRIKPSLILIPHPSFNQDHQTIYEACMVALRPHDQNHFVPKVLMYDVYDYTKWGENQMPMNYFKYVDIESKLKAYKTIKSQIRSYRSPEKLRQWASNLGERCNLKYAEGFKILRWVDVSGKGRGVF